MSNLTARNDQYPIAIHTLSAELMMSPKLKNLSSIACAASSALIFALAFSIGYFDGMRIIHFCVAAMIGASSASLILSRYIGRRFGLLGMLQDLILIIAEVFVAILIAGNLVFPVFGTILAPLVIYIQIKETPALGGIIIIGAASTLLLARVRQRK